MYVPKALPVVPNPDAVDDTIHFISNIHKFDTLIEIKRINSSKLKLSNVIFFLTFLCHIEPAYQEIMFLCPQSCLLAFRALFENKRAINPIRAGGGKIRPPLDLFVNNFFIVAGIDLKFSVNSQLSFSGHMKIFRNRSGS